MTMIIATLAWAFAAFVILHDNAKTRRDLKAFEGQFNGNMKSFWSRMFENETLAKQSAEHIDRTAKLLIQVNDKATSETAKLEQKAFFELQELREVVAHNVDNMSDRFQATNETIGGQSKRIAVIAANVQDLVLAEIQRDSKKKKKVSLKTAFKKIGNRKLIKGSRARA